MRASPLDLGDLAHDEDRRLDAALQQRPGDDEAVPSVVPSSAEDRDVARFEILERGLHRRHDLPSGILHEDNARDADVFYRAAVGFAHLRAGENAHAGFGRIVGRARLIRRLRTRSGGV